MIDVLIRRIADGDLGAFEKLYERYKRQFISYFRFQQYVGAEEVLDLYQDACTILFNNIHTGRLVAWTSEESLFIQYLFKIGRNILFNKRRKRQPPLFYDDDKVLNYGEEESEYEENMSIILPIVRDSVNQMRHPCSQLLNLVVFEKKSHEEVARIMNYAGPESVATQKSRCMDKLKTFVKKQFKERGYEYEARRIQSGRDSRKRHS